MIKIINNIFNKLLIIRDDFNYIFFIVTFIGWLKKINGLDNNFEVHKY